MSLRDHREGRVKVRKAHSDLVRTKQVHHQEPRRNLAADIEMQEWQEELRYHAENFKTKR